MPSSITENFFGTSGDVPSNFFQPALAGFVLVDTDFSRWTNWEGKAPAEPKTAAICEWRVANGETANFLEGSAPALPKKFFGLLKTALRTSHSNLAHWEVRPPNAE